MLHFLFFVVVRCAKVKENIKKKEIIMWMRCSAHRGQAYLKNMATLAGAACRKRQTQTARILLLPWFQVPPSFCRGFSVRFSRNFNFLSYFPPPFLRPSEKSPHPTSSTPRVQGREPTARRAADCTESVSVVIKGYWQAGQRLPLPTIWRSYFKIGKCAPGPR